MNVIVEVWVRGDGFVDLIYFDRVAKLLSFKKAAASLGCSVSTFSCAVRRLENRLGFKVFERTTRFVRLTPAGQELWLGLTDHIAQIHSEYDRAANGSGRAVKEMILNAPAVLRDKITAPALEDLRKAFPSLWVELRSDERILEVEELKSTLTLRIAKEPGANLPWVKVAPFDFVHVCSESFTDLWGAVNSLERLNHLPSLCYSYSEPSYSVKACPRSCFVKVVPQCVTASSDPTLLVAEAVKGRGVLLAPRVAVQELIDTGDLIELFVGCKIAPKRYLYALAPDWLLSSDEARAFLDSAREYMNTFVS